ncbi:MAG: hypothetical protein AB7N76_04990 [Planctomycetota bacterium]
MIRERKRWRSAAWVLGTAVVGVGLALSAAACGPALTIGAIAGIQALEKGSSAQVDTPPAATVTTPAGVVNDVVTLSYRLTDPEQGDRASVVVEFSLDGGTWKPATQAFVDGAEGTTNLVAAPAGTDHVFFWNTTQDLSTQDVKGVRVRVTPRATSTGAAGQTVTTQPFDLFNRYMTSLASQPTSFPVDAASIALAANGDLLVADAAGNRVLRLSKATGALSVLAGTGTLGFKGGGVAGAQAQLAFPLAVATAPNGDLLVADFFNFLVRRIGGTDGFVSEVAGQGGETANGQLASDSEVVPRDLVTDAQGNVYLLDEASDLLRVINLQGSSALVLPANTSTGKLTVQPSTISTLIGDGDATAATNPGIANGRALALFSGGGARTIYVVERGFGGANFPRLRALNLGSSSITLYSLETGADVTIAPGGQSVLASGTKLPSGLGDFIRISVQQEGVLVVPLPLRNRVAVLNLSGAAATIAGTTVAARSVGFVAGSGVAGTQGDGAPALEAQLLGPGTVAVDAQGTLFVGERAGRVRVFAGSGGYAFGSLQVAAGRTASLPLLIPNPGPTPVEPVFLVRAPDGSYLLTDNAVSDPRSNRVVRVGDADGALTPVLGSGAFGDGADGVAATAVSVGVIGNPAQSPDGRFLIAPDFTHHRLRAVNLSPVAASFLGVTLQPGEVRTVVGVGAVTTSSAPAVPLGDGGPARQASVNAPVSAAFDQGGLLWIGDSGNHRIRVANPLSQPVVVLGKTIAPDAIETVVGTGQQGTVADAGDGGPAGQAKLDNPAGLIGPRGELYLVDGQSPTPRVRVVNTLGQDLVVGGVSIPPGAIQRVIGSGLARSADGANLGDGGAALSATFQDIAGMSITASGLVWLSDASDHRVRVANLGPAPQRLNGVELQPGLIQTALGDGTPGFGGDPSSVAKAFGGEGGQLERPRGVLALEDGRVLVMDGGNSAVRLANFGAAPVRFAGVEAAPGAVVVAVGSRAGRVRVQAPAAAVVAADGRVVISDVGRLGDAARVLSLDPITRLVTLLAGAESPPPNQQDLGDGGPAVQASLSEPRGLALDASGSLYLCDAGNRRLRFVNRTGAPVTPIPGVTVPPGAIATLLDGSKGDQNQANDDGAQLQSGGVSLTFPSAISLAGSSLWVADEFGQRLLRLDLASGTVAGVLSRTLVIPDRTATLDDYQNLGGTDAVVAVDDPGNVFSTAGARAGDVVVFPAQGSQAEVVEVDTDLDLLVTGIDAALLKGGTPSLTYRLERPFVPSGVAAKSATEAYVAIQLQGYCQIARVTDQGTQFSVSIVAGDTTGDWNGDQVLASSVGLRDIQGLWLDGEVLYAADAGLHRVVAINLGGAPATVAGLVIAAGEARTVAGGGQGQSGFNGDAVPPPIALLSGPSGVVVGPQGGVVIVDQGNARVRRFQR